MTITDGRIKKKIRKALKYVNKNKQGNDYMKFIQFYIFLNQQYIQVQH